MALRAFSSSPVAAAVAQLWAVVEALVDCSKATLR
jgi:hypothetical protein